MAQGGTARTMVLKAEGITCAGCAEDMEKVLRRTEGILEASVDYPGESVRLVYDPDRVDRRKIFAAVRRMVRGLSVVSEGP